MQYLIYIFIALQGLAGGILGYNNLPTQEASTLGAVKAFSSAQLSAGADNGECLTTDGTNNSWSSSCGSGSGGSGFSTTSADYWLPKNPLTAGSFIATSTATSTFAGGIEATKIAGSYLMATSTTATSTLSGALSITGQTISTNNLTLETSSNLGLTIRSASGVSGTQSLNNQIRFIGDSTYGYGVVRWDVIDSTRGDVILQAHKALYTDSSNIHNHLSWYFSNAARTASEKHYDHEFACDICEAQYSSTTLTIHGMGSSTNPLFHVKDDQGDFQHSGAVMKLTGGSSTTNAPYDDNFQIITFSTSSALTILNTNSAQTDPQIDMTCKFCIKTMTSLTGGYSAFFDTSATMSPSNGQFRMRTTNTTDTGTMFNMDSSSLGAFVHYYRAGGTTNSRFIVDYVGRTGISTSSPWALLSVAGTSTHSSLIPLFAVSTSTSAATTTAFVIDSNGKVGIGTTTPGTDLAVHGFLSANAIRTYGATSTFSNGIELLGGCFKVGGGCLTSGSGAFAWTPTTNYGAAANSTSTPIWFQNGLQASSTARLVYASTTALTASGNVYVSGSVLNTGGYVYSEGAEPYFDLFETDTSDFGGVFMRASNLNLYTDDGSVILAGSGNTSNATDGVIFGTNNDLVSPATNSFALGINNTVTGAASGAMGSSNTLQNVTGTEPDQSFAIGDGNLVDCLNSIAIGYNNEVHCVSSGFDSFAIGNWAIASGTGSHVIGRGADTNNRLLNNQSNSLYVGFDSNIPTFAVTAASGVGTIGKVGIGTTSPYASLSVHAGAGLDSFAVGSSSQNYFKVTSAGDVIATGNATGTNATKIGSGALATQSDNIAIGTNAAATGNDDAIAIGRGAKASDTSGTAIGDGVAVHGYESVGIGSTITVSAVADSAVAIGGQVNVTAIGGTSIGYSSDVAGDYGTAIGYFNEIQSGSTDAVAIGNNLTVSSDDVGAIAIGSNAATSCSYCLGFGAHVAPTSNNQIVFGADTSDPDISYNHMYLGAGITSTQNSPFAINVTGASGANKTGYNLSLASGQSTGSGLGGSINFLTTNSGAAGSSQNATTSRMFIAGDGRVGISSTSPWAMFSVSATSSMSNFPILAVSTSTASATSTAFVIDSNGKVGVGTTSPMHDFSVEGIAAADRIAIGSLISTPNTLLNAARSVSGADTLARFQNTSGATNGTAEIGFTISNAASPSNFAAIGGQRTNRAVSADTNLIFSTLSNSSLGVRMTLRDDGNLGIGTSTPPWMLQVNGTRPSIAISDSSQTLGQGLRHWLISSMGGNLYVGTSTDLYATSSPAALTILNGGKVGVGTSTPSEEISTTGDLYVTGTIKGATFDKSFGNLGSTTPDAAYNSFSTATSTFVIWRPNVATVMTKVYCSTDKSSSTATVEIGNGTASTTVIADYDSQEATGSVLIAARGKLYIGIKTASGSPNVVDCTNTFYNQ